MERLIDANKLKADFIGNRYGVQAIEYVIDQQPTVEPVRHGKWLYGENEYGHDGYYCSQCGEHIKWRYGEEDINFIKSYNYCPNCGAKMTLD